MPLGLWPASPPKAPSQGGEPSPASQSVPPKASPIAKSPTGAGATGASGSADSGATAVSKPADGGATAVSKAAGPGATGASDWEDEWIPPLVLAQRPSQQELNKGSLGQRERWYQTCSEDRDVLFRSVSRVTQAERDQCYGCLRGSFPITHDLLDADPNKMVFVTRTNFHQLMPSMCANLYQSICKEFDSECATLSIAITTTLRHDPHRDPMWVVGQPLPMDRGGGCPRRGSWIT